MWTWIALLCLTALLGMAWLKIRDLRRMLDESCEFRLIQKKALERALDELDEARRAGAGAG